MKSTGTLALLGTAAIVAFAGVTDGDMAAQTGGQQPAAPRLLVTTTMVKPGMGAAYRTLMQNEAVPANKKAGVSWRWVFQSGPLSGAGNTYVTVIPIASYAQFDGPNAIQRALGTEGAAKFQAKLQPMIDSTHNVFQTLIANASLQSFPSNAPPLVRVTTLELLPGKGGEFTTLITQDYLPALKKAGVADYLVFATNYGGAGSQRSVVEYLSKYADLDQPAPINRALGQEGAQKLNQRRATLISRAEAAVYRLVPELSYGAPTRPKS